MLIYKFDSLSFQKDFAKFKLFYYYLLLVIAIFVTWQVYHFERDIFLETTFFEAIVSISQVVIMNEQKLKISNLLYY